MNQRFQKDMWENRDASASCLGTWFASGEHWKGRKGHGEGKRGQPQEIKWLLQSWPHPQEEGHG